MKHLLLFLVFAIAIYFAWTLSDKKELAIGRKVITKHGTRLGAIVLLVFALLAAAYYLPSTNLL